jgi:hypothetical protein
MRVFPEVAPTIVHNSLCGDIMSKSRNSSVTSVTTRGLSLFQDDQNIVTIAEQFIQQKAHLPTEFWFLNYYILILQSSGNSISEVSGFPKMSVNIHQTVKPQKAAIFIISTCLNRMNENVFYKTEYFSKWF